MIIKSFLPLQPAIQYAATLSGFATSQLLANKLESRASSSFGKNTMRTIAFALPFFGSLAITRHLLPSQTRMQACTPSAISALLYLAVKFFNHRLDKAFNFKFNIRQEPTETITTAATPPKTPPRNREGNSGSDSPQVPIHPKHLKLMK